MRTLLLSLLKWLLGPLVLVLLFLAYAELLRHTLLSGDAWAAGLLAVGSAVLLWSWRHAVGERERRQLLSKPSMLWHDGDAVAVSGRLCAGSVAIHAPASGRPCSLYEYRLTRQSHGKTIRYGRGLRIADAALATDAGPIELKGQPSLEPIDLVAHNDAPALERFARHVLGGAVDLQARSSALQLLGTREKLRAGIALVTERGRNPAGQIEHEVLRPHDHGLIPDPLPWEQAQALCASGDHEAAIRLLATAMLAARCTVWEQMLPPDAEVCVFGTWRASEHRLAFGPSLESDRRHALVGVARAPYLVLSQRSARRTIGWSLALMLAVHLPLVALLAPTLSMQPYREGLVTLHQLQLALRGRPESIWPLLGPTRRPDAVAAAIEARRHAALDRMSREHGGAGLAPAPAEVPETDRLRAIEPLLRLGLDLNAHNENGRLVLLDARGKTLDLLLRFGANVRGSTGDGWTALHAAAAAADPERVERLLRAGADPQQSDVHGNSALDIAISRRESSREPDEAPFRETVVVLLRDNVPSRPDQGAG